MKSCAVELRPCIQDHWLIQCCFCVEPYVHAISEPLGDDRKAPTAGCDLGKCHRYSNALAPETCARQELMSYTVQQFQNAWTVLPPPPPTPRPLLAITISRARSLSLTLARRANRSADPLRGAVEPGRLLVLRALHPGDARAVRGDAVPAAPEEPGDAPIHAEGTHPGVRPARRALAEGFLGGGDPGGGEGGERLPSRETPLVTENLYESSCSSSSERNSSSSNNSTASHYL